MTLEKINLQLFADGLIGDGVEDDDPTVKDVPIEEDEDDFDLSSLLGEEEDEEPEEAEEEPAEEPQEEPEPPANGKFYTQAELDALISSRVQREQAKYQNLNLDAIRKLEKAAGMPVNDILEHVKGNKIQSLVDEGVDEDKARKQVEQELHFEELQERVQRSEKYIQTMTRSVNYEREKNAVINKNPLYKKFESEIDTFSAYGENLGFEDAAKYIIGDKIAKGELIEDIRKGAENKILAGSQKRGKATIESGSQAGGKPEAKLSPMERKLAREFGFTDKEWLDSKTKIDKQQKRSR